MGPSVSEKRVFRTGSDLDFGPRRWTLPNQDRHLVPRLIGPRDLVHWAETRDVDEDSDLRGCSAPVCFFDSELLTGVTSRGGTHPTGLDVRPTTRGAGSTHGTHHRTPATVCFGRLGMARTVDPSGSGRQSMVFPTVSGSDYGGNWRSGCVVSRCASRYSTDGTVRGVWKGNNVCTGSGPSEPFSPLVPLGPYPKVTFVWQDDRTAPGGGCPTSVPCR